MIIVCASEKGGCGKSTMAVNLSVILASDPKKRTMLVDADPQATASRWVKRRYANNESLDIHHSQNTDGSLSQSLKGFSELYDYVVVDIQGRVSKDLIRALCLADILLMPFRCTQADIETIEDMSEIVEQVRPVNESLKVFCVLNAVPTTLAQSDISVAHEYFKSSGFAYLNTMVRQRKAFSDSIACGRGVVEMSDAKAKQEMELVYTEIMFHA